MYQGIFLDDRESDAQFAELMSSLGDEGVKLSFLRADQPLVEMADRILESHPQLVALDYRLDEKQADGSVPTRYKAGPLAQQLRDRGLEEFERDFPIVLVSHEDVLRHLFDPDRTTHDLFDRIYVKEEVARESGRIREELSSLVKGYRAIVAAWRDPERLVVVLRADETGKIELESQDIAEWKSVAAPHQLARLILRNIIDRNGILLDDANFLASFGVAPGSEGAHDLMSISEGAGVRYSGAFAEGWRRWWTHRYENFALGCGKEFADLTADERVRRLNEKFSLKLRPAVSRWTGRSDFYPSFACSSCGQPTEKMHSVAAYDVAPAYVKRKRICWKCVQTGEFERKRPSLKVDDGDKYIADKLMSGVLK